MKTILGLSALLGAVLLTACGGSSGGFAGTGAASELQITLCSLGCSGTACSVNEMATNQDISITFNDDIDPATVNFTTFSIVETTTGSVPIGFFLVQGPKVIFRPALIQTEAGSTFGFEDGATYRITIPASPEDTTVIRSTIGRPNLTPLTCVVTTSGITDLVPGRPTVELTPSPDDPPSGTEFDLVLVFNDLMQTGLLVDSEGQSPTIGVFIEDSSGGEPVDIPVNGTFTLSVDQNALLTTVRFQSASPYPGNMDGQRRLRVDLSQQISDLAGNSLLNAGSFLIDLPATQLTPGSFVESFDDELQFDPGGSAAGLWASPPGFLDSGLEPDTGLHRGGGSGILGDLVLSGDLTLDTDGMTLAAADYDILLNEDLFIPAGEPFPFTSLEIPEGSTLGATGSSPLRLWVRGSALINGAIDLSGEDAPPNFGKYFPPNAEEVPGESLTNLTLDEADGGEPGLGRCGGGDGGFGGASWYTLDEAGLDYYDEDNPDNFASGSPDPARFTDGLSTGQVHGFSGDGIGGRTPTGRPVGGGASQIATDWSFGSGIGSWAWPPLSNQVPDAGFANPVTIESHWTGSSFANIAFHRSRGGGGGGFWSDGEDGVFYDAGGMDPLGVPLFPDWEPVVDAGNDIHEYNDLFNFDGLLPGGGSVPDGAGGAFDPGVLPGIETLDPEAVPSLLVGGAGGGGAGMSQHGSWNDDPLNGGDLETYRTCDGAGGGAGGSALQLQVAGDLTVNGTISVEGGDGGDSAFMVNVPYSPSSAITLGKPGDAGGGGGSGGALLLQVGGDWSLASNSLLLGGGQGGTGSAGNHGGDGGSGLLRFETATGTETAAQLAPLVDPDEAFDLAPVGGSGANVAVFATATGDGDIQASDGTVFNGNASGVRSLWYQPAAQYLLLRFTGWTLRCEYDDQQGGGPQELVFSHDDFPVPGVDPLWIAFQTGWGAPGAAEPEEGTLSEWIVVGTLGNDGGLAGLQGNLARMLRFQVVFDMDRVASLIGSDPAATFRVKDLTVTWEGE